MALLNSLLQNQKPCEWEEHNYNNVRYVRIPISQRSVEYFGILSEFKQKFGSNQDVVKIERVQHPFAYARFKIRKEHLQKISGSEPAEVRQFFQITDADAIDKILEYNCDHRRGGCNYSSYHSSLSGRGYVLAVKTFSSGGFDTRDTHRYPEYLIQYGSGSSELGDLIQGLSIY